MSVGKVTRPPASAVSPVRDGARRKNRQRGRRMVQHAPRLRLRVVQTLDANLHVAGRSTFETDQPAVEGLLWLQRDLDAMCRLVHLQLPPIHAVSRCDGHHSCRVMDRRGGLRHTALKTAISSRGPLIGDLGRPQQPEVVVAPFFAVSQHGHVGAGDGTPRCIHDAPLDEHRLLLRCL